MIKRTIGILGLLASVMALSSLIYGAFQEPLGPYMEGIMGGVLDSYRLMRDYMFAGLGSAFSGLINYFAQWVTWLPPVPWFNIRQYQMDLLTLHVLFQIPATAIFGTIVFQFGILHPRAFYPPSRTRPYPNMRLVLIVLAVVFWPFLVAHYFWLPSRSLTVLKDNYLKMEARAKHSGDYKRNVYIDWLVAKFVMRWLIRLLRISTGAILFFLLLFAENQIGL